MKILCFVLFLVIVVMQPIQKLSAQYLQVTISNNSIKNIHFHVEDAGCPFGFCSNPYGPVIPTCCAAKTFGSIYSGESYGALTAGEGGGSDSGIEKVARLRAHFAGPETNNVERVWTYKFNNGFVNWGTSAVANVKFPEDFEVTDDELKWLLPPISATPQKPSSLAAVGALKNLQNTSNFNFMIKGHPLYAGTTAKPTSVDASQWQTPSSQFSDLWDGQKVVQLTGSYGNISRTITITPTEHAVSITDAIAGTTTTKNIDLDTLVGDYSGFVPGEPPCPPLPQPQYIVQRWDISLVISDESVTISDLQITRAYNAYGAGCPIITEKFLIQSDKVQKSTSTKPTWQTITDKPKLDKYIH